MSGWWAISPEGIAGNRNASSIWKGEDNELQPSFQFASLYFINLRYSSVKIPEFERGAVSALLVFRLRVRAIVRRKLVKKLVPSLCSCCSEVYPATEDKVYPRCGGKDDYYEVVKL